jgi:hypothetical protein
MTSNERDELQTLETFRKLDARAWKIRKTNNAPLRRRELAAAYMAFANAKAMLAEMSPRSARRCFDPRPVAFA